MKLGELINGVDTDVDGMSDPGSDVVRVEISTCGEGSSLAPAAEVALDDSREVAEEASGMLKILLQTRYQGGLCQCNVECKFSNFDPIKLLWLLD